MPGAADLAFEIVEGRLETFEGLAHTRVVYFQAHAQGRLVDDAGLVRSPMNHELLSQR